VEAVADYVNNIRPRFGAIDHPALWVTERGGRIKPAEINARFVAYRDALGLPRELSPHSLRHSYVISTSFSARGTAQSGAFRVVPHKYLAVREARATRPVPRSFSLRCWF